MMLCESAGPLNPTILMILQNGTQPFGGCGVSSALQRPRRGHRHRDPHGEHAEHLNEEEAEAHGDDAVGLFEGDVRGGLAESRAEHDERQHVQQWGRCLSDRGADHDASVDGQVLDAVRVRPQGALVPPGTLICAASLSLVRLIGTGRESPIQTSNRGGKPNAGFRPECPLLSKAAVLPRHMEGLRVAKNGRSSAPREGPNVIGLT